LSEKDLGKTKKRRIAADVVVFGAPCSRKVERLCEFCLRWN